MTRQKSTKDDLDLVAAALGLKSSAWAKAIVYLTEPEFGSAINGKQVIKDERTVMNNKRLSEALFELMSALSIDNGETPIHALDVVKKATEEILSRRNVDDLQARAEAAEQEVREILNRLKHHCKDDFVVIGDGGIDWSGTVDEFVSFIKIPLHEQYAHEGGKPQIMTVDILKRWIAAIDIPAMTDIYQTNTPNVFYATFALPLRSEHFTQLKALNVEIVDPRGPLKGRVMLKWQPPRNDEL